jgi:hypothetical protein
MTNEVPSKSKMHSRRAVLLSLCGIWLAGAFVGCASGGPNQKVRHGLEIEVDKSVGRVVNVRYTYGDDFVDEKKPSASFVGPMFSYIAAMRIPEEFQISWETLDGKKHQARVPVRSRISVSVENKFIVFVIMQDHVEGNVAEPTPFGRKRERFY